MQQCLIKTIFCEQGELFHSIGGRNILLARCEPRIEIYEESTKVPILRGSGGTVRTMRAALVICPEPALTREVDAAYLNKVEGYTLCCRMQRKDGIYEQFTFSSLIPYDIELLGNWTFELDRPPELIQRLINI